MADFDPEEFMKQLQDNGDGMYVPVHIFGGGLTDEQKRDVEDILASMDRAQHMALSMAKSGHTPATDPHLEGLRRVCMGITDGAAKAIVDMVTSGKVDPISAVRGTFAGIAMMMFVAGQMHQKELGRPEGDRRPAQPLREMTDDPSPEEAAEMKDLFARLGLEELDPEEG